MHTRRRFGSGVGLRARKCMHLGMHTKCIQNAYKHIKREKERILPSTSSLYCLFFYLSLPAISDIRLLLPASSGVHGPHQASLPVLLGHGRRRTRRSVIRALYAHSLSAWQTELSRPPPSSPSSLRSRPAEILGGGLR